MPTTELPKGPEGPGGAARKTVLVVDDQATIRNILVQVLTLQGYRVLSAVDGLDALRVALDTPEEIDVLITDLSMPRMGGAELIGHMMKLRPTTRTICLSAAFSSVALNLQVLFLPKPFSLHTLSSLVKSVLEGNLKKDALSG